MMSGYVKRNQRPRTGIYTDLGLSSGIREASSAESLRHHGKGHSLSDAMQMQGFAALYGWKANLNPGLSGLREIREVALMTSNPTTIRSSGSAKLPMSFFKVVNYLVRYRERKRRLYRNPMKSRAVPLKLRTAAKPKVQGDLELAPERVLRRLQSHGLDESERGRLIIEAEVLDFSGDQAALLVVLLRQFIDARRDSNTLSDLVAVASAIRKFVRNCRSRGSLRLRSEPAPSGRPFPASH